MTDRELVARIARSAGQKAGYKQLVRELGMGGGRERRQLLEQLDRLAARGQLLKLDREHWGLPQTKGGRENLVAGRLDLHRDGYGFVRPLTRQPGGPQQGDIFIPPDEINGAMQGDQVLVDLLPPRPDGRSLGRIARILERRNTTVVGLFHYDRRGRQGGNAVTPFDDRMQMRIVIPEGQEIPPITAPGAAHRVFNAAQPQEPEAAFPENLEGLVVDVEITRWPTPSRPAEGRILEVLGHPEDFGVDVEMMIRKHQLPRLFPEAVLEEARAVARLDAEKISRRRDFRALDIVTIDGETAKDFDDAVLVTERPGGGYELQVHIADVAEYVRAGGDLDLEARLRGNSVYFPDRAIPMLPRELSTDICSLRPGEERLTLGCLMQLDAEGRIVGYEITEGVIRSAARMTYTEVHGILEGDAELRAKYAALVPNFERMHKLALLMNKRRQERGSIDFDLPEPVIEFDEQGRMRGVTKSERTWANRLIEEFMLAANECVATWLEDLSVPSIYRIHERPEARRVVQFEELAAAFGYSLGLGALPVKKFQPRTERRAAQQRGQKAREYEVPEEIAVTPRMYQKLAAKIEGQPEERILSYLMLRSLQQARYSEKNEGHFALAAPTYTHFTSPIRRYTDLIVHRICKALLRAGVPAVAQLSPGRLSSPWTHTSEFLDAGAKASRLRAADSKSKKRLPAPESPIDEGELAQIAEEASLCERRAAEAERELIEWKKVRFMQDRVGEQFAALALNPAKYGIFVELTDLFVEGLVPIDSLRGDRYEWRETSHEIVGVRTGRVFRAGDRLEVTLDRVLVQERKLQFSLVEEDLPAKGKAAPGKPKKAGKKEKAARAEKPAAGKGGKVGKPGKDAKPAKSKKGKPVLSAKKARAAKARKENAPRGKRR